MTVFAAWSWTDLDMENSAQEEFVDMADESMDEAGKAKRDKVSSSVFKLYIKYYATGSTAPLSALCTN